MGSWYKARSWIVRKLGGEMPLPGAVGNHADVVVSTRSLEKVCACQIVSRTTMIRDAEFCEKYAKECMGRRILAQMMEHGYCTVEKEPLPDGNWLFTMSAYVAKGES